MRFLPFKRMPNWIRAYKCYRLKDDIFFHTPVKGYIFDSVYLSLSSNGQLITHSGYTWNGCTPKFDVLGAVLGTPEGVLNPDGYPKTYFPSLVHDALYQIANSPGLIPRPTLETKILRKDVDLLFYVML